jgi:hypothetical protein
MGANTSRQFAPDLLRTSILKSTHVNNSYAANKFQDMQMLSSLVRWLRLHVMGSDDGSKTTMSPSAANVK